MRRVSWARLHGGAAGIFREERLIMGTINAALNLITGALDADQNALDVVSNNVANASNESYTREVPNWEENQPIYINGLSNGSGATVTGGISQRDRVLEQRLQ